MPAAAPAPAPARPMLLDGDDDPPASILEVDQTAGEGGGIRGLLVSLLTIMDVNHNGVLSREEFTLAAEPLGFDVSDGAWADLRQRFGDQQQDKPASEQADVVDLSLVGALFSNKYDPLLEELLRRLLKGVMVTHRYARQMEGRLRVVEEHLEQTSMRELRERKQRIEKTLRRWRNKTAVIAFDGWKSVVVKGKDILQRTMKHWSNQTYSLIWRRWRDFVRETIEQRESAKRAIARMKNRLLTGCFEMWVEQVKLSIEQRDAVLARAAARLLNRDLAGAFSLWAERSRTHAHARELQRKVIMRLMMGLFADVFYAWAEMVGAEVARQDSLLRAAANRLFRACLVQTYQKWRRLTAEAVAARLAREEAAVSLAISFLAPMVSKVFGAWRSWTSERRTRLARAAYAIGPARLLFMCMRTWAANVREAVRQREREHVTNLMQETLPALIAASIEGRLQAQLQESVEEVQSQSAESSKEMDEAMVALKRQVTQLQRELSTLAERRLKERQATVQRVLRSWRNGTLQKAYLKWTQAVEHSKHMVSRAVGHWFKRGNGVGRAWLQWAAVAAYEKHVVGGAKVIAGNLAGRTLRLVAAAWRDVAREQAARRRHGVATGVVLWAHRTLSLFFYPWRALHRRDHKAAGLRRRVLKAMAYDLAARTFDAFAELVSARRSRRHSLLLHAFSMLRSRTLLKVVASWRLAASEGAQRRGRIYANVVQRMVHQLASIVWDGWRRWLVMRRAIIAKAAHAIGVSSPRHTFGRWKAMHKHKQRIAQTQWLLQDLRLVGVGWLAESLDAMIPNALPPGSHLAQALHRHLGPHHGRGLASRALSSLHSASPSPLGLPPPPPHVHGLSSAQIATSSAQQPSLQGSPMAHRQPTLYEDEEDAYGDAYGAADDLKRERRSVAISENLDEMRRQAIKPPPPIEPHPPPMPRAGAAAPAARRRGVAAESWTSSDEAAAAAAAAAAHGAPTRGTPSHGTGSPYLLRAEVDDALHVSMRLNEGAPDGAPDGAHVDASASALTMAALSAVPQLSIWAPSPTHGLHAHGPPSVASTSLDTGSVALAAFGSALESQLETGRAAHRAVDEDLRDVRGKLAGTASRIDQELRGLQQLQLEHARQTMAETTQREREADVVAAQLRQMNERLREVDETCVFLKDTLYSILTARSASNGLSVPSTKALKPLKAHSARRIGDSAPWTSAMMPGGL